MIESILVIRLRELGDTLLTTPLLRQLRRLHPQARINVLCQKTNHCILEHNPHVDHTIVLSPRAPAHDFLAVSLGLRRQRYDMIVDVQSLPKTALIARLAGGRERLGYHKRGWRNRLCYTRPYRPEQFEYAARQHLRLLQDERVDLDDVGLDFPVAPEMEAEADAFCRRYFRGPVAAIFPVCRFGYRDWDRDKTAAVADRLANLGLQPWLVYGPGQEDAARDIASRMQRKPVHKYTMPSFAMLRAIFARCELFFGNDGGPKHAAVAAGIPTVTVYRPEQAVGWAPTGNARHRVATTYCPPGAMSQAGTSTTAESIRDIPVAAVWKEITASLRQRSAATPFEVGRVARAA